MSYQQHNNGHYTGSGFSGAMPGAGENGAGEAFDVSSGSVQRGQQYQLNGRTRFFTGVTLSIGYVVVIWGVFLFGNFFIPNINRFGIHPWDVASLWHVVTAPLLHINQQHVAANTVPGALFVFLIGLSGKRTFCEVTLIAGIVGGIGTWFFGGVGTNHIGASGLIYGWLGYLVVRGFANRSLWQIVLGVVLAVTYSSLIFGLFPTSIRVSWQGHLFGGLGGVLAGLFITSDDPPALQEKRKR